MIEYPDLEQGSPEWLQARCGVITASVVGKLLTPTLKVANNDTSRGLITTLAAERITGCVEETYPSRDMQRGTFEEPFARDAYAAAFGVDVTEVGFILDDTLRLGYSPDGLVGDDGLIEIKSRRQKAQVATIIADEVPAYNMAQLQAGLLVSGRAWIDYVSFSNGMPLYVKRVLPDERWIDAITAAATAFEEAVQKIEHDYDANCERLQLPRTERIPDIDELANIKVA